MASSIVLTLDEGALSIHLGMTGRAAGFQKPGPYARAIFKLDQGGCLRRRPAFRGGLN